MFSYYLQAVWGMHDLTFILYEDKLDATFLSIHIYEADNRYLICFGGICKCTTIFRVRSNSDYDSGHLLVFFNVCPYEGTIQFILVGWRYTSSPRISRTCPFYFACAYTRFANI